MAMRSFFKNITSLSVLFLSLFCIVSCSKDEYKAASDNTGGNEKVLMVLRISPINASDALAEVTEKIQTLRIIIIGQEYDAQNQPTKKYVVECNRLINLGTSVTASQYSSHFTWPTKPGAKKIYLIANEASVKNLSYQKPTSGNLPKDLPTNLSDLLNSYGSKEDSDDSGSGTALNSDGDEFEQVINSVYFEPTYTPNDKNEVFLPYVSFYDGVEAVKEQTTNVEMFLVPVATKFVYEFYNNRDNPVEVRTIDVTQTDSHNFLTAHIDKSEQTKQFEGNDLYWIDWLAKVAEESQKHQDFDGNVNFNEKYGWISNYSIPTASGKTTAHMIGDMSPLPRVPGKQRGADGADVSGRLTVGPFYYPESRNFYNADKKENESNQIYCLTLDLFDVKTETSPVFENIPISNLQALFRNTCVIIRVTMGQGNVDVYAEMMPWNVNKVFGSVVEQ